MKKLLQEKALRYLEQDLYKNCDLIDMIKIYSHKINYIYVEDNGVCFTIPLDNITCVSTDNKEISSKIASKINKMNNCICKTIHDKDIFSNKFKFDYIDECYQVIFNKNEDNTSLPENYSLKKLNKSHIDFIVNNYSGTTNYGEISSLMELFKFYGIFNEDNEIAGFVGKHQDGEIGFLEVLEKYRRKGFATKLLNQIIEDTINDGLIAYSQVKINNTASIKLHKQFNCNFCPTTVFWCYN